MLKPAQEDLEKKAAADSFIKKLEEAIERVRVVRRTRVALLNEQHRKRINLYTNALDRRIRKLEGLIRKRRMTLRGHLENAYIRAMSAEFRRTLKANRKPNEVKPTVTNTTP